MSGWHVLHALFTERAPDHVPAPETWGTPPDPVEHAGPGRRWGDLNIMFAEQATPQPGTLCPRDGTVLQPAPGGGLRCPFDGWAGDTDEAMA